MEFEGHVAEEDNGGAEVRSAAMDAAKEAAGRKLKWYVVHTYSGFEQKAKKSLEERAKLEGLDQFFGDILVPTEDVVEMVRGAKRKSKRKFFP